MKPPDCEGCNKLLAHNAKLIMVLRKTIKKLHHKEHSTTIYSWQCEEPDCVEVWKVIEQM